MTSSGYSRQSTCARSFHISEMSMEYLTSAIDLSLLPSRARRDSIPQKFPCSAQACDHAKGWPGRSNVLMRLNAPARRWMSDGHPMDERASFRLQLRWVAKTDSADNQNRRVNRRVDSAPAYNLGAFIGEGEGQGRTRKTAAPCSQPPGDQISSAATIASRRISCFSSAKVNQSCKIRSSVAATANSRRSPPAGPSSASPTGSPSPASGRLMPGTPMTEP